MMQNGPTDEGQGRNWNKAESEHPPYTISSLPEQRLCRTVTVGEAAEIVLQRILVRELPCAT